MSVGVLTGYFDPIEIAANETTRMIVPSVRQPRVRALVPFHSPVTTPTMVEKNMVEAIMTAKEM